MRLALAQKRNQSAMSVQKGGFRDKDLLKNRAVSRRQSLRLMKAVIVWGQRTMSL